MKRASTLWLAAGLVTGAPANVSVPAYFSDGMVLQRDRPIRIWGQADPAETVRVWLGARRAETMAGPTGEWKVTLQALPASNDPAELVIEGSNRLVVRDILLGDVWLCSGQSNMQFTVYDGPKSTFQVNNAVAEVAAANHPLIRQFKFVQTEAEQPRDQIDGKWAVCSPATVSHFTAAGYFFAREVQSQIHVPIGLLNSSVGNTPIEAWISAAALDADPAFQSVKERWQQAQVDFPAANKKYEAALAAWKAAAAAAPESGEDYGVLHLRPKPPWRQGDINTPGGLFNGMIHPLLPIAVRGVLWYQGENNTGRSAEYRHLFAGLIADWRRQFGQGDLPFFFVQLAGYGESPTSESYARLREAQAEVLDLPETGMAVAIDIGDPLRIHPHNKQEVGRRLALLAERKVYGLPVACEGPSYEKGTARGHGWVVEFAHADKGLVAQGGRVEGFALAGADRKFHAADAVIEGNTVVVQSAAVDRPVAVRYAFGASPAATLYNGEGLPAVPFRTDRW